MSDCVTLEDRPVLRSTATVPRHSEASRAARGRNRSEYTIWLKSSSLNWIPGQAQNNKRNSFQAISRKSIQIFWENTILCYTIDIIIRMNPQDIINAIICYFFL